MRRLVVLLAFLGGCTFFPDIFGSKDDKDRDDPLEEKEPSKTVDKNLTHAAILRDWRTLKEPAKATYDPTTAPKGVIRTPAGVLQCSADQTEIQTFVMRDPREYNSTRPRETALFCPGHGTYWYDFDFGENKLHQVYGPFRLGP